MDPVILDKMSRLIEQNMVEYYLSLGRFNNSEVCDTPVIKYIFTNCGHNRIFMADFQSEDASSEINRILSRLNELKIPAVWYMTPMSRPAGLEALLVEHGFTHLRDGTLMAMDITAFRDDRNIPEGLKIGKVVTVEDMNAWGDVLAESFEIEDREAEKYKKYFTGLGVGNGSKLHFFLGKLNGKPVASGCMFKGKEVAGIYWIGTLKEARGQGIGMAMVLHILNEAKNSGYGLCTLIASKMGYPLYKKIGFDGYHTTKVYRWRCKESD